MAFGSTTGNLYVSDDGGESWATVGQQPAAHLLGEVRLTRRAGNPPVSGKLDIDPNQGRPTIDATSADL